MRTVRLSKDWKQACLSQWIWPLKTSFQNYSWKPYVHEGYSSCCFLWGQVMTDYSGTSAICSSVFAEVTNYSLTSKRSSEEPAALEPDTPRLPFAKHPTHGAICFLLCQLAVPPKMQDVDCRCYFWGIAKMVFTVQINAYWGIFGAWTMRLWVHRMRKLKCHLHASVNIL